MMKKFFTVRCVLTYFLILSVIFAAYGIYYKIKYWGFDFTPKKLADVWTIEAHISFNANGEPIRVSLATPRANDNFKILEQNVVAPGYKTTEDKKKNRIILTAPAQNGIQNIYYQVMLYDNHQTNGKTKDKTPPTAKAPVMDEQRLALAKDLLRLSKKMDGNEVQQVINLLNSTPPDPKVLAFLPVQKDSKVMAEAIQSLLLLKGIPTRISRGIKLAESKKSFKPDIMIETYQKSNQKWYTYNITTAQRGLPDNFILFQRGGNSLIDVAGGEDSVIKFSVLKSVTSSLSLAGQRAKFAGKKSLFEYSIYNLPLAEQNTLKWLSIFPLAILIIVLMRNVVGIQTMGTFTPMLLSMSLIKTGFWPGLICFAVIVGIGLFIRFWLSKLNLLLVPRISAVVIFVIIIMQILTILGYQLKLNIALSAVFFPIIIMAWIIERASITWEEDGAANACREIAFSLIVAVVTYFIISSEYIRHIMFVFNEINLVILCLVMLLGTYTGYRLTELKRFRPLVC